MKIKEIFLTVCSLMACFTACTNEEAIDGPVVADGTISVSFSIDGILTKATEEAGSVAEYTVSKSTVALFDYVDNVPTNCIGFSNATPTPSGDNGNLYTVSGIDVKSVIGKPVYVLVIANSDKNYTKDMTYKQYMADIIQTESFAPSSLVKVGGKQHTFAAAASSRTVNVQLTQLPARVDVKFAFPNEVAGHSCTFNVTSYKIDKVNRSSRLILPEYGSNYTYNTASEEVALSWTKQENESGISTFSFYTYEKATAFNPVVLTITGELFDGTIKETKTYTLSLNPTSANGGETNGLIHGHLYDVTGNIDLTTKQVTFAVQVKEWETVNVDAKIKDVHYLFVKEHEIHMPDINKYEFEYASDLDVTYEIVSVRYTGYNKNGDKAPGSYTQRQDQYPTVNVNSNGKITVSFRAAPVNYVPTHIELKVKTKTNNLEETVKIIHYPTPYVEVHQNNKVSNIPLGTPNRDYGGVPSGLPGGRGGDNSQTNYNLFMITSIAAGEFIIGDPRGVDGKTKTTAEANNLVSPKFVIASQRGITLPVSHSDAESRCSQYKEYPYMTAGTWRIPTTAELKYVAKLQNASNSAVKSLLEGDSYWSAHWVNKNGIHVNMNDASTTSSDNDTYVRCVHDVY